MAGRTRYSALEGLSAHETIPAAKTERLHHQIRRKPVSSGSGSTPLITHTEITDDIDDAPVEQTRHRSKTPNLTAWTPQYLRTWVLSSFLLLFVIMIAALQVLLTISNMRHGIVASQDRLHYLWTYSPTALLTLVMVYWNRVDYQAKQAQPWSELASGNSPGSDSLLLDYITPFFLVSFKNALKKGHLAIVSTITVSLITRLLIIISTGLMDLETVSITGQATDMILQSTFNQSTFVQGLGLTLQPEYEVYTNLIYNLTLGAGLTSRDAVQPFLPASIVPASTRLFTAVVDVLRTEVTCETANATFDTQVNSQWYYSGSNVSYTTSDCEISTYIAPYPNANANASIYCDINGTDNRVSPWIWSGRCSNVDASDTDGERVGFVAYVCEPQGLAVTATLCRPSYSIRSTNVTLDAFGNVIDVAWNSAAPSRQLSGLSGVDLVMKNFQDGEPDGQLALTPELTLSVIGILGSQTDQFTILALNTGPSTEPDTLTDPNYMASRMTELIPRLGSQVAHTYLLSPGGETKSASVVGTIDHEESRLVVRNLPVRLMQSICALNALLTVLIILTVRRNVAPPSILTVGGVASVLARSPQVVGLFRGSGASSMSSIKAAISGKHFSATATGQHDSKIFRIEMTDDGERTADWTQPFKVEWERPLVLRWWSFSLVTAACVAIITVLEVFLQRSQQNDGIASVQINSNWRYLWLYIPTAVLSLISMLFGAIVFNLEFSHPYFEITQKFVKAESSLFWCPSGDTPLRTAWRAFRASKYALSFAFIATLVAPLLTIVASGLFSVQNVPSYTQLSIQAKDWFDLPEVYDGFEVVASLVTQTNMSYPTGTYDEIVFPNLDFGSMADQPGNVSVRTPALRTRLDCHSLSADEIANITVSQNILQGGINAPAGCSIHDNGGFIDIAEMYIPLNYPVPGRYIGVMANIYDFLDLDLTSWCPAPFFTAYGQLAQDGEQFDNLQAYLCSGSLEVVTANVTFDAKTSSVVQKPVVDESTARNFSSWVNRYQILSLWANINGENSSIMSSYISDSIVGRDGVSVQALEDPDTFLSHLQHVYRQYNAQIINFEFRNDSARTNTTLLNGVQLDDLPAVYVNNEDTRLIQSVISTQILVGLLSILIICSLVILFTFNGTTPKAMGSLAAMFSLLADSRIVDEANRLTPIGAEWLTYKEAMKQGLWKDEEFRLKWWNDEDEKRRSYGVSSGVYEGEDNDLRVRKEGRRLLGIDSKTVESWEVANLD